MNAAREAGATEGEIRQTLRMAERVRGVQLKQIETFTAKVRQLATDDNSCPSTPDKKGDDE